MYQSASFKLDVELRNWYLNSVHGCHAVAMDGWMGVHSGTKHCSQFNVSPFLGFQFMADKNLRSGRPNLTKNTDVFSSDHHFHQPQSDTGWLLSCFAEAT